MTHGEPLNEEGTFWRELETRFLDSVQAKVSLENVLSTFSLPETDRVTLMRYGLTKGSKVTAFYLAQQLSTEEKMALLPEWILYAIHANSEMGAARQVIRSLPRAWLLQNIAVSVEPILQNGDVEDYSGILDLCVDLEAMDLFAAVVGRALVSPNPSIRQVGEDGLATLERNNSGK